ncbi:MAG: TraG/TraD/VirD4 family protein [Clostridia bacterium]|nr:TraG/TraD/VirD4 family protein [Clostridia bacterium]
MQYQIFGGFLTVGGGRGIRFNLFVQSFSQLNEKYGDNTAQNILDNCYVWNYLKTSNEVTAEKISKKIGTYTTSSWSESNSSSGGAVNKSKSMNLTQRPLLTTDEILRIERPYLLVMCSGHNPFMSYSPDLSKWKFNNILGLGNKEWNTKVRKFREDNRKSRKVMPLKLWDIEQQTKDFKAILLKQQIIKEKEKRMKDFNL